MSCLFCSLPKDRVKKENQFVIAIDDGFPVTRGHTLIIPKRHCDDFFNLTNEERLSAKILLEEMKNDLISKDIKIEGFNIGVNCGEAAGQTIFHCHIHLIPRRKGDVENPRGGIRHVIPDKGFY